MKVKTLRSFEKSGTTCSATKHHVPVDLNLYQRIICGLKSADTSLYKRDSQIRTPATVMTNARNECQELVFESAVVNLCAVCLQWLLRERMWNIFRRSPCSCMKELRKVVIIEVRNITIF